MGKYIRHGIGVLVGAALGTLTSWLQTKGIEVDPETITTLSYHLTSGLTLAVTLFGYAATEKFLKRFPVIDLQGYIDRLWLKKEADAAEANPGYAPRI